MGRREEETRKAIKEAKKETFVGTKERIMHEMAISLAVIADMMTDKAESVLDKIRAEIDGIEITGQIDEHMSFIRTGDSVKKIVLEILDKYR